MMRAILILVAILIGFSSFADAADPQTKCAIAALIEYKKASLSLTDVPILMSVEAIVAQRRLQERYCLQHIRCFIGDSPDQDMRTRIEFAKCLREESEGK